MFFLHCSKDVNFVFLLKGADGVVNAQLLPTLVMKLKEESLIIQLIILDTLHYCAIANPLKCLEANIMPVLKVNTLMKFCKLAIDNRFI